MKAPTYRIPARHPVRPLVDWYLFIFDIAGIANWRFRGKQTWKIVKNRLTRLRGAPQPPDIARAARLLPDRALILRLDPVLTAIRTCLNLVSVDAAFPWVEACEVGHAIDAESLPWRQREEARFLTGAYAPLPWADKLPPIPDHYAHLSTANAGLIAFTDTPEKAAADIQTPIKPGRYLARFYPNLAPHEVRDLQELMPRAAMLHFAVTADDIERIYVTGPQSCMSHELPHFDGPCHPVRVYGDSDLQLAYITNTAGVPTARALIWPEKKRHGRIYGHESLLAQALESAGYESSELTGARIRRIPVDGDAAQVVMPYIDTDRSFGVIDGTWLCIGGPYDAEATNGLAALSPMTRCQRCDARIPEDSTYAVGDEAWCEDCRDNYTFVSDFSGEEFPDEEQAEVVVCDDQGNRSVRDWSASERDEHATYCSGSDQWYATKNFDFVTLANGNRWEASHFAEHGDPAELPPETPRPDAESTTEAANDAKPIRIAERAV
jgi:hypothetical protein